MNEKRLTKKQMWIFAVGQLGWSILGGIINAWLVTFYLISDDTHNSGVEFMIPSGLIVGGFLTVIGLITFCCRLWDAVSDPLIANFSDNSKNKKGRRMPFMRFAAIPFALVTVLVFCATFTNSDGTGNFALNIVLLSIFLVLFYTFMTIYCTPYNALISEFGKTQQDRMNISTYISLTYFAGTLLAYTPFVFGGILPFGYYWNYRVCFIVLAVIAAICMLLPTFLIKETDYVEAKPLGTNAFKSLKSTFKNKDFRVFTGSDIMYWIGLTLFQTGLPFFVTVSMELDASYTMIFMGAMTVLSACFYPFVDKMVKKFGKKKLVITGFLGLALAYLITAMINIITAIPGIVYGIVIVVIAAVPMALLGIIPQSIVADVAEAESITTGENRQGMFFAARTFAMKLGQSIAMLAFTSLAILGKAQDLSANDISASTTGLMIVAFVAVVFCCLGALILMFYREKKIMTLIAKEGDEAYLNAIENQHDLGEDNKADAPLDEAKEEAQSEEEK